MSESPRFDIDALIARYELEPELNDIFVEGEFDREIIELLTKSNKNYIVYSIDSVNVPTTLLKEQNLTSGNKQRVIALAAALEPVANNNNYKCLVDKDFDHWLNKLYTIKNLSWTQYTSLEMYFYTIDFLDDVLIKAAKCRIKNLEHLYESLTNVLKTMYAAKLAGQILGLDIKWPKPDKYLVAEDDFIKFNSDEYVVNAITSSGNNLKKDIFLQEMRKWHATNCDPRTFIRGHDFSEILHWAIKNFKGLRNLHDETVVSRLFVLLHQQGAQVLDVLQ